MKRIVVWIDTDDDTSWRTVVAQLETALEGSALPFQLVVADIQTVNDE